MSYRTCSLAVEPHVTSHGGGSLASGFRIIPWRLSWFKPCLGTKPYSRLFSSGFHAEVTAPEWLEQAILIAYNVLTVDNSLGEDSMISKHINIIHLVPLVLNLKPFLLLE